MQLRGQHVLLRQRPPQDREAGAAGPRRQQQQQRQERQQPAATRSCTGPAFCYFQVHYNIYVLARVYIRQLKHLILANHKILRTRKF